MLSITEISNRFAAFRRRIFGSTKPPEHMPRVDYQRQRARVRRAIGANDLDEADARAVWLKFANGLARESAGMVAGGLAMDRAIDYAAELSHAPKYRTHRAPWVA